MKTVKVRYLVAMLLLILGLSSITAYAKDSSGQCGETAYWSLDKKGVMTISGTGAMWDFRNDADYFDYHPCPWTGQRAAITKVVFQSGITYVGADAFTACKNLKQVSFPETLTSIGCFSFLGCENLQNFTLPDSLQGIGQQAFDGCKKITKVVIPDNVTFLDAGIFGGATALTDVYIGGKKGVSTYIYSNCIFRDCTALEEIKVSPDNLGLTAIDGILYSKDGMQLAQYPLGRKDKKVVLPSGTKEIMQFAIEGAVYLEEIVLPEGLEFVGTMGICRCPELKALTIPSSMQVFEADNGLALGWTT